MLGLSYRQDATSQVLLLHPYFPEGAAEAQRGERPRVTWSQSCEEGLLFLLSRWGKQGTERLSDLLKVTQLLSGGARVLIPAFGHKGLTHFALQPDDEGDKD